MVDEKLSEYIRKCRQRGDTDDKIRRDLAGNGWSSDLLNEAFDIPLPPVGTSPVHFLSIGQLFSESFFLFKKKFWSLLLIMIIPGLLITCGGFLSAVAIGIFSTLSSSAYLPLIIMVVILFLVFAFITTWSSVALITSLASAEKLSFRDALRKSIKFVFPFLLINFQVFFIQIGGTILFIVPAIIFSIWFAFSMFVLVVDGKKGFQALMTSREYVRGRWWAVVGRFLLLTLVFAAISALFSFLKDNSESILLSILISILNIGASLFSTCYFFTMYKNLKEVRGNFELRISRKTKIVYSLIGILGFLSIFALPVAIFASVNPIEQINKAKNTQIENQKVYISNAINRYAADKNLLPQSLNDLVMADYILADTLAPADGYCFSASVNLTNETVDVSYGKNTEISCNSIDYLGD